MTIKSILDAEIAPHSFELLLADFAFGIPHLENIKRRGLACAGRPGLAFPRQCSDEPGPTADENHNDKKKEQTPSPHYHRLLLCGFQILLDKIELFLGDLAPGITFPENLHWGVRSDRRYRGQGGSLTAHHPKDEGDYGAEDKREDEDHEQEAKRTKPSPEWSAKWANPSTYCPKVAHHSKPACYPPTHQAESAEGHHSRTAEQ